MGIECRCAEKGGTILAACVVFFSFEFQTFLGDALVFFSGCLSTYTASYGDFFSKSIDKPIAARVRIGCFVYRLEIGRAHV